jgi:dTDP-4-dehydrorhamnose reductase
LLFNKIETEFTYRTNHIQIPAGHCLDITSRTDVANLVDKIKPDLVIHTVALTNVDLCETNPTLADSINIDGTKNVVLGCQKVNCKLVFISTSFVFDGKQELYSEEDTTSPATYYGYTKFRGEEIVKNSGLPYLILRTDQPYCWVEKWQHSNSVLRVLEALGHDKVLKEVVNWCNTPTYVPDFVKAAKKLFEEDVTGIYHLVGSDFINRCDWSLLVAEIFGFNKKMIEPVTSDTFNLPAKRVNVHLSNNKLQKTGIRMMGIREGLMEMLREKG